jgi:hypothetical protein
MTQLGTAVTPYIAIVVYTFSNKFFRLLTLTTRFTEKNDIDPNIFVHWKPKSYLSFNAEIAGTKS